MALDYDADEDCEYPEIDKLMKRYVLDDSDANSGSEFMDSDLEMTFDTEEETKDDDDSMRVFVTSGRNKILLN